MIVCAQVYQSLQRSGECSKETLNYFDREGADVLLYELRFNAGPSRPDAATYIAENQLDTQVFPELPVVQAGYTVSFSKLQCNGFTASVWLHHLPALHA